MPLLKASQDFVIVKPASTEEKKLSTGIIQPGVTGKQDVWYGEVVSVGPGRHTEFGSFIAPTVVEGETVMYDTRTATPFPLDRDVFVVLRQHDVIAKIEQSAIVAAAELLVN